MKSDTGVYIGRVDCSQSCVLVTLEQTLCTSDVFFKMLTVSDVGSIEQCQNGKD